MGPRNRLQHAAGHPGGVSTFTVDLTLTADHNELEVRVNLNERRERSGWTTCNFTGLPKGALGGGDHQVVPRVRRQWERPALLLVVGHRFCWLVFWRLQRVEKEVGSIKIRCLTGRRWGVRPARVFAAKERRYMNVWTTRPTGSPVLKPSSSGKKGG